jgi:hypothetical protein
MKASSWLRQFSETPHARQHSVRVSILLATIVTIVIAIPPTASACTGLSAAGLAGSHLAARAVPRGVVLTGGMVRQGVQSAVAASVSYPSCSRLEYHGSAGHIDVQENKKQYLQWGIVMTPYKYSVGSWHVSTYLSGRKTTSGFNKIVKKPYTPHGSLSNVRSGKIFHVEAEVVNQYGTFENVPNACRTI